MLVMPGLDPGIHPSSQDSLLDGLPGKPGNDEGSYIPLNSTPTNITT
jgi:hypothetical protein